VRTTNDRSQHCLLGGPKTKINRNNKTTKARNVRKFERHSEIDEWQSYEKCSSLLYHEAAFHTSHILDHIFFCKFELHVIFCKQTNFRANKKIFPLCIITYFRHEFRPSMHCKPSNVRTNLTTAYQRCYRKAQ